MAINQQFVFAKATPVNMVSPEIVAGSQQTKPIDIFQEIQTAYQKGNFELITIYITQSIIEPVRIYHGVQNGKQVEHHIYLNGPAHEILKTGDNISYFEQGKSPFTLAATKLPSLLARVLNCNAQQFISNYRISLTGRNRIAGHIAQLVRIIPKDPTLYSMQLWIEQETKLPLRFDLLNLEGDLIQQVMVVDLSLYNGLSPWLEKVSILKLPDTIATPIKKTSTEPKEWEVTWLPKGMVAIYSDSHILNFSGAQVNYQKFSNGIVDISVYSTAIDIENKVKLQGVRQGASNLYLKQLGEFEITVVADLPIETVKRIANSIQLKRSNK